ncbi:MAG: hypothetical protein KatS3mg057_3198 [Herpetosiphonaceae bacterium]|nr:MAG: hypothetical protein KatS3mg057_3198 [Herpetosiphonaceae bacterium]
MRGARANNLKNLTVRFPLGTFICVTGVSGSGKSTLITEVLYRRLAQHFYGAKERPGEHDAIVGLEHLDKVIDIDQSPIGRTPRSNPATYTGVFTPIRELFAQVPEARLRGYKAGRFSFNVKGGRCEACEGAGIKQISMQFLPDVYVPCEVCKGKRYNREALEIRYKGRTIADVLEMTVTEAHAFFGSVPAVASKLKTLEDVGLATFASASRRRRSPAARRSASSWRPSCRAARPVGRSTCSTSRRPACTSPTWSDCWRCSSASSTPATPSSSSSINLDVIKCADWLIDLGPEGEATAGGLGVVAEGTPEQVAACPASHTGRYLRPLLRRPVHGV